MFLTVATQALFSATCETPDHVVPKSKSANSSSKYAGLLAFMWDATNTVSRPEVATNNRPLVHISRGKETRSRNHTLRITAILRESASTLRILSVTQTVWRCAQSRANSSPLKIPANREKYREYLIFGGEIVASSHTSAHTTELIGAATSGRTGNFVEISGNLESLMWV